MENNTWYSSRAVRRLLREIKLTQQEPSWGVAACPVSEDNLFAWHCNVAGQPADGGAPIVLHLELTFPVEYPDRPPHVEVLGSTVNHPNVFNTFICLDMLEGGEWAADEEKRRPYSGWSSAYSVLSILRQLQTFFFEGDGTRWWKCATCTLHNPIHNRKCEVCDEPRGRIREISIEVSHHDGFKCRCGHQHDGVTCPAFPDPEECDDAPCVLAAPVGCPEDECTICLGKLDEAPAAGPLMGAPCARPLSQLFDSNGGAVCGHWFHAPCARCLQMKMCPLCRTPFDHVEARDRVSSAAISHETSTQVPALKARALLRMAKLAEWPLEITVLIMSMLRRSSRMALASAVPAWQTAFMAPDFWEAQELLCFHEKSGPSEDIIGIGVLARGRWRLSKLTAHFDAISLTAWEGGLRRAAWKEPLTHWLPLHINHVHAQSAASFLHQALADLADCAPKGSDSHLPSSLLSSLADSSAPIEAVNAVVAITEMMQSLLKEVLDGDRHASVKLLKGYFVLHRLFLHCCETWPMIRTAIDTALKDFTSCPEHREKNNTPWLAHLLQLLTVSDLGWHDFKDAFLEECLAREVPFTRRMYPRYSLKSDSSEAVSEAAPSSSLQNEWQAFTPDGGSEDCSDNVTKAEVAPGVWQAPTRGWFQLRAGTAPPRGSIAFSVTIQRLPRNSVVRIGWTADDALNLLGTCTQGWGYHASGGCFGRFGWKGHQNKWARYGRCFKEGDTITARLIRGYQTRITFACNGVELGDAYLCPDVGNYAPTVAIKRGARVRLLPLEFTTELHDCIAPTMEQSRDMAWVGNRKGNTLVMFQVFFVSLVRPSADGPPDWKRLQKDYDERLGFPSPKLSAALFEQFTEVHRVRSLSGNAAWPLFLSRLGFGYLTTAEFDKMLIAACERADRLNYRIPGRHDHA